LSAIRRVRATPVNVPLRAPYRFAYGSTASLTKTVVEVETDDGTAVFEGKTRDDVPALVAELVAAGRRVYGVRVLTSTLEETYLEAVGEEQS